MQAARWPNNILHWKAIMRKRPRSFMKLYPGDSMTQSAVDHLDIILVRNTPNPSHTASQSK